MIGRKLVLGLVALTLCLSAAPASVYAKACPAKCKVEIKTCRTACNELSGKAKKQCKRACKKSFVTLCKERQNPDACSPSGAFLDELY
ncbi:MAG: hypothetical protein ACREQL_16200 [Candidatus Binatia bacterium]